MKRNIIEINKELCNGCGLCANACHEGAIQMVNGKAELISDKYCDGLGDCLPACPTGAIKIIERDADEYSQEAVNARMAAKQDEPAEAVVEKLPCGCPGTMAKKVERPVSSLSPMDRKEIEIKEKIVRVPSELSQWPVQLKLVNSGAEYLKEANLLIAADCTAYAYGKFHQDFIKGRITLIGCPKLDDNDYYTEKLAEIFRLNNPKSITVVRMEVPCCGGIVTAVKKAMLNSGTIVPYREVTIGIDGSVQG